MNPSDVRKQILGEHERLRDRLRAIEADLAAAPDAGTEARLRAGVGELFAVMRAHVQSEEALLVPALLATDAWGPQRAAQIRAEHVTQLDLLAGWDRQGDGLPVAELAARLRAFAAGLRADMDAEEHDLLHPDVLRDDVIAVQQASS